MNAFIQSKNKTHTVNNKKEKISFLSSLSRSLSRSHSSVRMTIQMHHLFRYKLYISSKLANFIIDRFGFDAFSCTFFMYIHTLSFISSSRDENQSCNHLSPFISSFHFHLFRILPVCCSIHTFTFVWFLRENLRHRMKRRNKLRSTAIHHFHRPICQITHFEWKICFEYEISVFKIHMIGKTISVSSFAKESHYNAENASNPVDSS